MAQNSSRLHRLLTLLDTGSTQATRFAAARQIGEIAKSHPQELNALLKKVSQYTRSKNWDTRVAAAHAIGAIAENVKHTSLNDLFASVEAEKLASGMSDGTDEAGSALPRADATATSDLAFGSFDINRVLEFGSPLLASGGQEYDVANDNGKNPAERLARQKRNLRRRLGLDVCEQFMDVNDVIKDEDLLAQKNYWGSNVQNNGFHSYNTGHNIQQLVATMVPRYPRQSNFRSRRLSARELNMLKRKAKSNAKDHTKAVSEDDEAALKSSASSNGASSDQVGAHNDAFDATVDEDNLEYSENGRWPFQQFVDQLIHDMFDPIWEVRHGSVMALREILTHQGACAGVYFPDPSLPSADLDDKTNSDSLKRPHGIDLNEDVHVEHLEPVLKRHKSEPNPSEIMSMDYDKELVNGDYSKTEAGLSIAPTVSSGEPNSGYIKVEPEFCVDGSVDPSKGGTTHASLPSSLIHAPENSKFSKLMKLAKYSYMKNWEFLQDCAIRFLCVLSLDRFGDYVSDQVVAPVRETCAQALGAVMKYMHPSLVCHTLNTLLQMQRRQEWEVRHGSLLGIKYLVAVRQEMLKDLFDYVLHACKAGLEDPDDDVRAVAAEALIPAATSLVRLNDQMLHSIVMLLWDILLDLDDLSPSTSSVMNLLAEIYSQTEMVPKMLGTAALGERGESDLNKVTQIAEQEDRLTSSENPYGLATLTPRLWPFMRHSITSVRRSAIRTLERLLEVGNSRSSAGVTPSKFWTTSILGDALQVVFQNLLLESNDEILQSSERAWKLLLQCPEKDLESAAKSYFSNWVQLATTPYGSTLDSTKMFLPVALPRGSRSRAAAKIRSARLENESTRMISFGSTGGSTSHEKHFDVPSSVSKIIVGADSDKSVTHTRVLTSMALGLFASKLPVGSWQVVLSPLANNLMSLSGVQRQVASMVIVSWFKDLRSSDPVLVGTLLAFLSSVKEWLLDLLTCSDPAFPTKDSMLPYTELARTYTKMRNEAYSLLQSIDSCAAFKDYINSLNLNVDVLSVDDAINFASKLLLPSDSDLPSESEKSVLNNIESAKQGLLSTSGYLKCVQNNLHVTVSSLVASAVVWMSGLPGKLNPVILPLMAAIKREQEEILQDKAADALAELIFSCVGRKPGPNDKLTKNICTLTCTDASETPNAAVINSMQVIEDQNLLSIGKRFSSHKSRGHMTSGSEDRSKMEGFISRRGSELAFKHLCEKFGSSLFQKLPKLWDCLTEFLKPVKTEDGTLKDDLSIAQLGRSCEDKDPQSLINNIQVVRSITPHLTEPLRPQLLSLLPCILGCVRHPHVAVRLAAARCITSMAKSLTDDVMVVVIENVIPMLSDLSSVCARQGAGMLLSLLVQGLAVELVPYAPFLVVPLLRCMSDPDGSVRQTVTHSFAALVPLLPLSKGVSLPGGLNERLSSSAEDVQFLEQLLDNSQIDDFNLNIDLSVVLRRYQQEGINWLAFLRRFKLHGILCDDMGLGKTLQASAIVASDIAESRARNDDKDPTSLIICPSTLVAHWEYEIEKYIDSSIMKPLQYIGSSQDRFMLRSQFDKFNVIITSYDIIRKDIDFLGNMSWNYCVLDEGHIIKNSRSKITSAVKQLKAQHRLILSGTPIQNNVLELWSLFDFLMPGFLGTEKQFQATYGKPLLAAKDSKCSAKDAEAGILAMEALHKQVMPFLLRRTKDEVLSDLPEKIIQDRYCNLSLLQLKLYDKFSSSNAKEEISTIVKANESEVSASQPKATRHVFQALQYLLKLCSHPLLVTGENPPDHLVDLLKEIGVGSGVELHELQHSPKLVALQEILQECGIGSEISSPDSSAAFGQHRVLIFAQHKAFLDIIEKDLFHSHMRSVTYLRLDGSVQPEKRFEIVKTFNSDPTIDVLLLTTHVGGLGLNLTSADTLVFMEHDWNPMKDLQAMDRAHRLGQRKVVNVHRLIMRGTLEEKVMSLQRFKVSVANAVINAENSSLKTMNTDQLLDLFTSTPASRKASVLPSVSSDDQSKDSKRKSGGKGLKSIMNGLDELWDQSQYADEYDLNQFLAKLNG
ncbi:TATA-binding protein-associated factor BTAF1-like [Phragmites australis]|uniref:TATA-binding protein-associated factor BTAF1-like n=1 Tax=Phragmites australis TaxID=29695 RepID=UPI002D78B75D|nr:TATA-binding protein-associated factor BTAF1-like [Phragmites australis]XP_062180642.1 TATA-binding protein-associated factor BTAF1-like [Phragmites australis]XP_062180643.1 TATA-binding protein-associated factor BTAF1-like [Phragmites australis]XP_062180644.1 TATA-binding protein-associated factor BTAF1-like [Phragmites australis]